MIAPLGWASAPTLGAEYVIHISVDGLNAGILQSLIDAGEAPNFKRFEDEGAWRNAEGSTTDLQADGNRDGHVDGADYELWKANFGQTATLAR